MTVKLLGKDKPETQVVWRSLTPGVKTTTIPDPGLFDGYTLDIKTTEGNLDQHIVMTEAGTIGGLPAITFLDRQCNLFLRGDAKTRDWVIRCLCCVIAEQNFAVSFQGNIANSVFWAPYFQSAPAVFASLRAWLQKGALTTSGTYTPSPLAGLINSSQGTLSIWLGNPQMAGASTALLVLPDSFVYSGGQYVFGEPLEITFANNTLNTTCTVDLALCDGGNPFFAANALVVRWGFPYPQSNQWLHIMLSWDTNFGAGSRLYGLALNDVVQAPTSILVDVGGAFSGDYTATVDALTMFPDNLHASSTYGGGTYDLWFDQVYMDVNVSANRRKFINFPSSTNPSQPMLIPDDIGAANLGSNGQNPTGSSPLIFLHSDAFIGTTSNYYTNLGSGGGFTLTQPGINAPANTNGAIAIAPVFTGQPPPIFPLPPR